MPTPTADVGGNESRATELAYHAGQAPGSVPQELRQRPSLFVAITSVAIMAFGIAVPFTTLGRYLGFTALPLAYFGYLALTLACYIVVTQSVKMLLLRLRWI